jgi:PAS domain S-box-containing protein
MSKDPAGGKKRIFADLVALHQSISAGEAIAPVVVDDKPSEQAVEPAPVPLDSRFELFCEHLPMGILMAEIGRDRYRHAETFTPVNVNTEYARLLGLARVTILESEFFDVLPGGRTDWHELLDEVAAKGRSTRGIAYWEAADTHIQVTLFLPRRDLLAVVIEDASMRVSATDSVSQHEQQLDSILRKTPELLCRFLPDGTLTYANRAYCEFFRKVREELVGHCFLEEVPSDQEELVRNQLGLLTRANPVVTYQHRFDDDAGARWVEWTDVALFDDNGVLVEYQSHGRDVTDPRKEASETARVAGYMDDLLRYRTRQHSVAATQASKKSVSSAELSTEVEELRAEVEHLRSRKINGELQVCTTCHRVHDDEGHWMVVPLFLESHTAARVGSEVCPYCRSKAERDLERRSRSK